MEREVEQKIGKFEELVKEVILVFLFVNKSGLFDR
jgi:hypothetical protein